MDSNGGGDLFDQLNMHRVNPTCVLGNGKTITTELC